jgi:centromeric protein E
LSFDLFPLFLAYVIAVSSKVISSVQDGMQLIALGNETRQVSSTSMNARSSRSHTIFRIVLEATKTEAALAREAKLIASLDETDTVDETSFKSFGSQTEKSNTVVSYLNLVDLAGSERQSHTKAEGKQLKEGAAINKSLLALGAVINKLSGGLDDDQEDDSTKKRSRSLIFFNVLFMLFLLLLN